MPIIFDCPSCGTRFHAKERLAGQRARCTGCGKRMLVPRATPFGAKVRKFAVEDEQVEAVDTADSLVLEAAPARPAPPQHVWTAFKARLLRALTARLSTIISSPVVGLSSV